MRNQPNVGSEKYSATHIYKNNAVPLENGRSMIRTRGTNHEFWKGFIN